MLVILISWGDDPYLYTINMIKIEITNINRNTKTFYQFLIGNRYWFP